MIITDLLNEFDKYTIKNIPRTNNNYANIMASATSLVPIEIEDEEIILKIKKIGMPSCIIKDYEIEVYCVTQ